MFKRSRYKTAAVLSYDGVNITTPEVSLTSESLPADVIVGIARRYGVPVIRKPFLARILSEIPQGTVIPEKLYTAIALILAEVMKFKVE